MTVPSLTHPSVARTSPRGIIPCSVAMDTSVKVCAPPRDDDWDSPFPPLVHKTFAVYNILGLSDFRHLQTWFTRLVILSPSNRQ